MFDISTDFMWGKPWPSLRIEFTGKSLAFGYTVRVVVTCNRETEKSVESRMIHTYVCDNIYILYISINKSMSIYIYIIFIISYTHVMFLAPAESTPIKVESEIHS